MTVLKELLFSLIYYPAVNKFMRGGEDKMKKKISYSIAIVSCFIAVMTGCGKATVDVDMALVQTDIGSITVPEDVLVVGLGEASHGVKEYQEMKAEVFQALVENNGCRTFVIEGDFGGALKVDDYIHGGEGTAKEAAAWIGFRIYRTEEMEALIEWMRAYNETAGKGADLHFYGMDMQRADSSKEYVFRVLEQVSPGCSAKYREALAFLNDDEMYDISAEAFEQGMPVADELIQEVDSMEDSIVEMLGNVIFINGHNGHIGKVNSTSYDCLGKLLTQRLGNGYFAIGTDAEVTSFNSQTDDGFEKLMVKNRNALTAPAANTEQNFYYIDFGTAATDNGWNRILSEKQGMTSLNVTVVTTMKAFYTIQAVPGDLYDAMIVFGEVSPTTIVP